MRTEYSHTKIPPAPILEIKFSVPGESSPMDPLPALVDTGSDFTLAPLSLLVRIDAPESRAAFLRGLWSEQRQVTLYFADLHLQDRVLPGIEVVGIADASTETWEDQEIILGRNVLNRLILILDGPNERTDILDQRTGK